MWLGTDKGIVKFDGNDLTVFEKKEGDTNTLSINSLGRIFCDKEDNFYIFGVGSNIDFLDTKTGRVSRLKISVSEENMRKKAFPFAFSTLYIENDSSLWAGMYNVGFLNFNRYTNKTTYYTIPQKYDFQSHSVYTINGDPDYSDVIWLGTDDGIYSFNTTSKTLSRNYHCNNSKDSVFYDLLIFNADVSSRDTIWFTIPVYGFGCYDIKSGTYTIFRDIDKKSGKINEHVTHPNLIQRKSDHEFYFTSEEGLPGIFNTENHSYTYFTKITEKYPSVQQKHYLQDSSGNFWSLVFYQLYKGGQDKKKFETVMCPPDANRNNFSNVFKKALWNEKSQIYYVVFDGKREVLVFDNTMKKVESIPVEPVNKTNNFIEPDIYDALLDKNGRLWLCGSTVWVYDALEKKMKIIPTNPKIDFNPMALQNMIYRNDYIYLQPSRPSYNAVYRINTNTLNCDSISLPKEITSETRNMNQIGKQMDVLEIDDKGEIAYLCYGRTLFQLNLISKKVNKIRTYSTDEDVKGFQHFYNMFWYKLDANQNLWVATLKDIIIYNPVTLQPIKKIIAENDTYPLELFHAEKERIMCYLYSNGVILYDYIHNREFKLSLRDGLATIFNSGIAVSNNTLFVGAYDYFHYTSFSDIINNKNRRRCYLSKIALFNKPFTTDTLPEYLHALSLPYNKNSLSFTFSAIEFNQPERLEYRYKLTGIDKDWVYVNYLNRTIFYNNLAPGYYTFLANVKNTDGTWSSDGVNLNVIIVPAWWQTTWFKIAVGIMLIATVYMLILWRIKAVRRQEQLKGKYEKEVLELEAKALRAQMNPHFIFNCMNSIKALIQSDEQDKAVIYLTTFSKLIRTIFNNSDKRAISIYDEIETCRLYTELESMRFDNKFTYEFAIDASLDLKSVMVPALIIQPFIENAIWHGIMPKEEGGHLKVTVTNRDRSIFCSIDDTGIGREMSKQNKFKGDISTHQSKGVHLTQARLDLNNLLTRRNTFLEIIDKKDGTGNAIGTLVVLEIRED